MFRTTNPLSDRSAVAAACANATTMKQALLNLGLKAHGSEFTRLRLACELYDIPLPQRTPKTPAVTAGPRRSVLDDPDRIREAASVCDSQMAMLAYLGMSQASKNRRRLEDKAAEFGIDLPPLWRQGNTNPRRHGKGDAQREALRAMSRAELEELIAGEVSQGKVLAAVGLTRTKTNLAALAEVCARHGLDLPNGRNALQFTPEEVFTKGSGVSNDTLKKYLAHFELMVLNVCHECGQPDTWNGKPLVLELDHINGDATDHRLENLRILCLPCHSQTPTFRGRNRRRTAAAA